MLKFKNYFIDHSESPTPDTPPTPATLPPPAFSCPGPQYLGDGVCDQPNNIQACDYDGGDCLKIPGQCQDSKDCGANAYCHYQAVGDSCDEIPKCRCFEGFTGDAKLGCKPGNNVNQ